MACMKLMIFCFLKLVMFNLLCGSNGQTIYNRTFLQPVVITSPTDSSSVCVGSSVIINCTIESYVTGIGFIIASAKWRRGGANITDSTPSHSLLRTQPGSIPVVTGLMVVNTTLDDDGTIYTCTSDGASNDFTSSVVLNVTGGPPSPITISNSIDDVCTTTISGVSWSPSTGDPVCGPVSYNVMISPSDGVMMMRITDASYNFTGLTPGTNYTVSVAGMNMAGVGQSDMMMFHVPTMTEAVPSSVANITMTNDFVNTRHRITVTWDAASSPYCGNVLYYEVMISSDEHSNIPNNMTNVTDLSMLTATFSDLRNATSYNITVAAANRVGTGNPSMVMILPSASDPKPVGAIIGGVAGGIATATIVVLLVTIICWCYIKKFRGDTDYA